jgi:hypothetical protein
MGKVGLIILALTPHSWRVRLGQINYRQLRTVLLSIPGVPEHIRRRFIGSYHLSFWRVRSLFMREKSYFKLQMIRKSKF